MAIRYERIPSSDVRLNRHIRHDDRSWDYRYDTTGIVLKSVRHTRHIPILDQGQLGSCTGNAGIGALGCSPVYEGLPVSGRYELDETGAVKLYSDATAHDDYPGQYPPDDTGSDGLTVAKMLLAAGEIGSYQHTFTLQDALLALVNTPVMVGVAWHQDSFTPEADGHIPITGAVAGGHQLVMTEIDVENRRVWVDQSWGVWGVDGRGYWTWGEFGALLADSGDVVVPIPVTVAPGPAPVPVVGAWRVGSHLGRTLYHGNRFEGILETPALAQQVADLLNGAGA